MRSDSASLPRSEHGERARTCKELMPQLKTILKSLKIQEGKGSHLPGHSPGFGAFPADQPGGVWYPTHISPGTGILPARLPSPRAAARLPAALPRGKGALRTLGDLIPTSVMPLMGRDRRCQWPEDPVPLEKLRDTFFFFL